MKFSEYALSQGCELLKDDLGFLGEKFKLLPTEERLGIAKQYISIWKEAMDDCEIEIKKQNLGRQQANIWLLALIQTKTHQI